MLLFCDLGLLNTEDMDEVSGTLTIPNLSDEQDIPDIEVSSAHIPNSCNYYNRKCNTIGQSDFFTRFSLCKKRIAGIKVKSSSLLSSHS